MSKWIDVTRTVDERMIQWPGDPRYRLRRVASIEGRGTANLSEVCSGVHVGTHIDAPLHYIAGGQDVAGLELDKLCGPAVVVHVRAAREVQVEDLEPADIVPGERVLLRTANEQLWRRGDFDTGFWGIADTAAEWLVRRRVPLVGIDYLSVDGYNATARPAHYTLLGAGVVVVESLDLSGVEPGRYDVVALPLKLAGSEASPARVILRRRAGQRR